MTKEEFINLIESAQGYQSEIDRWDNFGLCLFELPIYENAWKMFDTSVAAIFRLEGIDWINWWLWERPSLFPNGGNNKAWDKDGNVIPTDTVDDLWELVKDLQK